MLDNWKQFENGTVLSHNLEGHGRYVRVRRQPNLPVAHASLDIVNEGDGSIPLTSSSTPILST